MTVGGNMLNEKKEPLLSVIIPIYNTEQYLRKCLNSVVKQSYGNLEIICINDGSTDGSKEILNEYAKVDKRIKVINQSNQGLVRARKNGLEKSRGDLIAYVDSDDWIDLEMYSDMVRLLVNNSADVVTSGCYREYGQNTTIESESITAGVYRGNKLKYDFLAKMVGHDRFYEQNIKVTLWSKIYRAELIKNYQMLADDNISIGEDIAVVYPLLLNCLSVVVSGKNYYHYVIRNSSMTTETGEKEIQSLQILEKHLKKYFSIKKGIPYLDDQFISICMFTRLIAAPETVVEFKDGILFPYMSVRKEDKVLIYGTGRYGKKLYRYLIKRDANIIGIVDQNSGDGVFEISELQDLEFDKIIIAILNYSMVMQVIEKIVMNNVPRSKIACIDSEEIRKYRMRF